MFGVAGLRFGARFGKAWKVQEVWGRLGEASWVPLPLIQSYFCLNGHI